MIDPLVKRDLALIAAGKAPVGNPDEAMASAILSIVHYLDTPQAAPEPPPERFDWAALRRLRTDSQGEERAVAMQPPPEPTGESAKKEDEHGTA